jgi:hypothetical protein
MRKSIEAVLRGYLLFRCDGRYYLTYGRARASVPATGTTALDGWHIIKGWRGFYLRLEAPTEVQPTIVTSPGLPSRWQASAEM